MLKTGDVKITLASVCLQFANLFNLCEKLQGENNRLWMLYELARSLLSICL